MKQEAVVWEKVFTNYISDKGLISEYIKYSSLTQKQMFQFFCFFFLRNEFEQTLHHRKYTDGK